jgi:hypothetical protein
MFYHALAAIPEWAPPGENHILYSKDILKNVSYEKGKVSYFSSDMHGTEFLRMSFKPSSVKVNGISMKSGFEIKPLGNGDYYLVVRRSSAGNVIVE